MPTWQWRRSGISLGHLVVRPQRYLHVAAPKRFCTHKHGIQFTWSASRDSRYWEKQLPHDKELDTVIFFSSRGHTYSIPTRSLANFVGLTNTVGDLEMAPCNTLMFLVVYRPNGGKMTKLSKTYVSVVTPPCCSAGLKVLCKGWQQARILMHHSRKSTGRATNIRLKQWVETKLCNKWWWTLIVFNSSYNFLIY